MIYGERIYEFIKNIKLKFDRSLRSLVYMKPLLIAILFSLSGCIAKNNIEVTLKNPKKTTSEPLNITVSNVQVINHQIIITGTNLVAVSNFKIKEGSNKATLQIESQTPTTIVANTLANVTFAAGKIFEFVFSSAQAASTFTVNFSLCDSTLGGKGFNCSITPNDKEVLSYDAVSGKWKPKAVNGLSYQGAWDATTVQPSTTTQGDYFIIDVANPPYQVGDWIVFNGTTFDRIDNSQMIISVFGRTGAVAALEGDYNLTKLSDVTITAPVTNQVLTYNGSAWVNGAVTSTESDPLVSAFAKAVLPTCGVGQVLRGDGTSLTCVNDNSGASYTGTANRALITDGAGALTSSPITTTILNYLSNVSSDIQTQINAKFNSSSFVDWSTTGIQTIDPTRLNLATANRVIVTNASSNPSASSVTSTELGHLSGVTSAIQTQLNSKLSSFTETDPGVTPFAKSALPNCNTGEVLKGNGTSLSCVTDNSGAGAYTGAVNRLVLTDGTTGALTVSAVTNTEAGYLSGVTSSIQTQLNAKQVTITSATALTSGSVQTNLQNAVAINPYNIAAGNTGEFRFYELVANGANYTGFKSPDLLGVNIIYTMPGVAPNAGEVLSSNAGGVLSWVAIPSAPVTSVNTLTGAVTLTTTNIAEGTNQYFTNTRVLSVPITAPTLTNSSIATNDTVQVSLGKLQAQFNNVINAALTGLSTATSSAITAADSILVAAGKLQAQITTLGAVDSNKLNKNSADSITAIVTVSGAGDIIVPSTPAGMTSAVNKTYVDSNTVANAGGAASVQIGTLAARPAAAAGNTGRMYVASDSGNESVFVSTGSAWIRVASNGLTGTVPIANGGTGSTTFTANRSVVVNAGATALIDGPSLDDTTAVAATLVKRGPAGEVVGQYLVPTTTVTEAAVCTVAIGTIAKDTAGNILTCQ